MPDLYIITGSNGAGKSTIGSAYLPDHATCRHEIFDGDKLFLNKMRQLFPAQTRSHKEARNQANAWLQDYFESLVDRVIQSKDHFAFEGHFSSPGPWQTPLRFKNSGYTIHLIFFGLQDPALSQFRVVKRSQAGGHYVNPIEVDRNFYGNLILLDQNFSWIDNLLIVDTSDEHRLLLHARDNIKTLAPEAHQLPAWFTHTMPTLTKTFFGQ